MKVREHRLMRCRGIPNWPPKLLGADGKKIVIEEFGVVRYVLSDPRDAKKCFLIIEENGLGYVGLLEFDDARVCARIAKIIGHHTGHSLPEIAEMDLDLLIADESQGASSVTS